MKHPSRKNIQKKLLKTVGTVALASFLCTGSIALASDAEEVIDSYGATKILAKIPKIDSFSHTMHYAVLDLSCDSCHPDIFEQKRGAAAATGNYTMAAFTEGEYCGACHDGDTAFSSNSQCSSCHSEMPGNTSTIIFTKPVKAVIFSHSMHVDAGMDCESCHDSIFQMKAGSAEENASEFTMQALYDGQYCGACHDGDTAFASNTRCNKCHIGVKGYNKLTGSHGSSHEGDEGKH